MFIHAILHKWEDVELEQSGSLRLPYPASLKAPGGGSIGFMEVFDSKEDALKAGCESKHLIEIRLSVRGVE